MHRDRPLLLLALSPSLLLLGLFVLLPGVWAIWVSLTNQALAGPNALNPRFVGLANYQRLLGDADFFKSLRVSVEFVFYSAIVGQLALGFLSALLLAKSTAWGKGLISAAILLPLAVPETVASLAWASLLAPEQLGTLNRVAGLLGLPAINWLQQFPLASIVVINVWRGIAFAMIIFLAAIESVPREVFEAAAVDGAGPAQQLWHITLPLVKYTILLFLLLTTITTFSIFGLVYVLTRGGPAGQTELVTIYIYNRAFQYFELGLGSAAAVLLLGIVLALGLVYVRLLRVRV